MLILFFDTETNGLPWNRHASYKNTENWPAILQISWQVWNISKQGQAQCLNRVNTYISPSSDLKWDAEAAKIHKLSLEELKAKGKPIQTILNWFASDCREVDLVVAHNMKFDKMALWAEFMRTGLDPVLIWPEKELCTMNATIAICKIPGKNPTPEDPYKWPRLSEVFQFLWPTAALPTTLHDANTDVKLLIQCLKELVQRRLVTLPACERLPDRLVLALRGLFDPVAASRRAASSAR